MYKDACKTFLDAWPEVDKSPLIDLLRVMERGMRESWRSGSLNPEAQTLQDVLLELHTMRYYARYGDYLAMMTSWLKAEAKRAGTEGHQLLRKTTTEISSEL